jgi:hypothetical protein
MLAAVYVEIHQQHRALLAVIAASQAVPLERLEAQIRAYRDDHQATLLAEAQQSYARLVVQTPADPGA